MLSPKSHVRRRMRTMGFDVVRSTDGELALSRSKAAAQLARIEARKGKTSKALLRRADEYAHEVFGDRRFALWLRAYAAMVGEFREGWMPKDYYRLIVLPRVNGTYGKLAKLKSLYVALFSPDAFVDLCGWVNGRFTSPDGRVLSLEETRERLFADNDRVIFKPDHGNKGRGIRILRAHELSSGSGVNLGNGVFQNFIGQHASLAAYCPSAVATVRLTTVLNMDGDPELRAAKLRLGRATEEWVKPSSQLNIPVGLTSGVIAAEGYFADWTPTSAHPDSGLPFSGFPVPSYAEAVTLVLNLHSRYAYVQTIGWDIAIDEAGRPQVMEWNGDEPGIGFQEWTQGPCFRGLGWEHLWRSSEIGSSLPVEGVGA